MSKDLVANLVSAKQFISWGEAARIVLGKSFRPTDSQELITRFNAAMPGADALLVDSSCKYSHRAPVEKHLAWLQANGYTVLPEVKQPVSKGATRDERLFTAQPVAKEAADTAKEIAELKSQLAAVLAALTAKAA
jgi:hypothetical protein